MSSAAAVHVIDQPAPATVALHPLRLRILAELAEPDSAAGLARRIGLPRQQLNYHLRLLEDEGLVEPVGERKRRNCTERLSRAVAQSYIISPAALGQVAVNPDRVQDKFSSAYLLAVAAQTIAELSAVRGEAGREDAPVPTLTLQTEVRFASPTTQHAFAEELSRELARLITKYHDAEATGGRRFRVVAGAYPTPAPGKPRPTRRRGRS